MDVQAWLEERDRNLVQEHRREARRALTKAEQAALSRHWDTDGAIHVSDVVLDLSPDELASCLAKTNDS